MSAQIQKIFEEHFEFPETVSISGTERRPQVFLLADTSAHLIRSLYFLRQQQSLRFTQLLHIDFVTEAARTQLILFLRTAEQYVMVHFSCPTAELANLHLDQIWLEARAIMREFFRRRFSEELADA